MAWVAYTDGIRLRSYAKVTDINVKIARREIHTSGSAQCNVVIAGCVAIERTGTVGRVVVTGCVAIERTDTVCRVAAASCVA
jgi:hypothetical protein